MKTSCAFADLRIALNDYHNSPRCIYGDNLSETERAILSEAETKIAHAREMKLYEAARKFADEYYYNDYIESEEWLYGGEKQSDGEGNQPPVGSDG